MEEEAIDEAALEEDLQEEPAAAEQPEVSAPLVLELRNVTFCGQGEHELQLTDASLQLGEGELAVVELEDSTRTRKAVSMIQGLLTPLVGEVLFGGRSWSGDDHDSHFQMRSRIGRVFDGQAWIENLNVNENVTLSRRHHGASMTAIMDDVKYWLAKLGVDHLSRKRPAFVEPSILQIHQWIRAFLGSPALIILERPMQNLSEDWRPKLDDSIAELRQRGVAVLWFANHRDCETIGSKFPTHWFALSDGQLRSKGGGDQHE